MNDNPILKIADAYDNYRQAQRKKGLMGVLGALGIGGAGLLGYSRIRQSQVQKALQLAAKKRRGYGLLAGLAGLGIAAPMAINAMNQGNGLDDVQEGFRGILSSIPGGLEAIKSSPQLSRILSGDISENVTSFRDNLMDRMGNFESIPSLGNMQESISGLFDKVL